MCTCIYVCEVPWRPEEEIESSGAGLTGGCELPDMGARNWTWYSGRMQVLLVTDLFLQPLDFSCDNSLTNIVFTCISLMLCCIFFHMSFGLLLLIFGEIGIHRYSNSRIKIRENIILNQPIFFSDETISNSLWESVSVWILCFSLVTLCKDSNLE